MQLPWARCSTGLCLGPRTHRIGVEIRAVKPPNAVSGDAAFSSAASRATACTAAVTRRHAAASIILPAMIAVTQPAQANEPEPGAPDSSGAAARTAGVDSGSEDPFAPKGGQGLPDVPLVLLQPAQPSPRNRKRVSRGRWPAGTASCNVSQIIKGCWQLGGAHRHVLYVCVCGGVRAALSSFPAYIRSRCLIINHCLCAGAGEIRAPTEQPAGLHSQTSKRSQRQVGDSSVLHVLLTGL